MKRSSTAVWQGTGKDGKGHLTSESKTLNNTPYSYSTRFENEIGTNPEELLAAAHAGCFTMQLAFFLQENGFEADKLETKSTITISNFVITSSNLVLKASVKGISKEVFSEMVEKAKINCPVSKLFKADISINHTLN